jgi:cysteine synthase
VFFGTFEIDAFVTVVLVAHVLVLADDAGLTDVVASSAFVNIDTDVVDKFVSISTGSVVTASRVFADAIGVVGFSTGVSSVAFVSVIADRVTVEHFDRPFGSGKCSVVQV